MTCSIRLSRPVQAETTEWNRLNEKTRVFEPLMNYSGYMLRAVGYSRRKSCLRKSITREATIICS